MHLENWCNEVLEYQQNQHLENEEANYHPLSHLNQQNISEKLVSINYHLTKACNYACKFCYARFGDVCHHLEINSAKEMVNLLSKVGTKKITFVGGEPLLYPRLGDLISYTKNLGITTMIVTNGSLINETFLGKYGKNIDWIGFSIESGIEGIENKLGRRLKRKRDRKINHVQNIRSLVPLARKYNIKIKINTVVTTLNWQEDIRWLIKELNPERWKVFQVVKIRGENDGKVEPLLITEKQFNYFVKTHYELNPITESSDSIKGSYVMIDPIGRFFDDITGIIRYSQPILEVGVIDAFNEVSFSLTKFYERGGKYNW